jgi:hypothetical protein
VSVGSEPLVIVGIDAGDPDFLQGWVREGHLPTLAGIMERGSWGRTGGPDLIFEHGVWVSLFSGIPRRDHGYYYHRQLRPGTYDLETVTGLDVDAPPFWTRIDPGRRRFALVDVPDYDPVPGIPGVQLTHWATHNNWDPDHFVTAAEPAEVLADVGRRFAPRLVTVEQHESTPSEDRAILDELLARVSLKGAACRHLLERGPFDVVVVVFAESHTASHQFWRYRRELNGAADDPALADGIREVYRAIDREVGGLLQRLPSESNVFVVSSVGMEDDFPAGGLIEAFCREFGYQASAGSPGSGRPARPIDWFRRVVPERWRSRSVGGSRARRASGSSPISSARPPTGRGRRRSRSHLRIRVSCGSTCGAGTRPGSSSPARNTSRSSIASRPTWRRSSTPKAERRRWSGPPGRPRRSETGRTRPCRTCGSSGSRGGS